MVYSRKARTERIIVYCLKMSWAIGALADVQTGLGDLIVFTRLDRWFRNISEYYMDGLLFCTNPHIQKYAFHRFTPFPKIFLALSVLQILGGIKPIKRRPMQNAVSGNTGLSAPKKSLWMSTGRTGQNLSSTKNILQRNIQVIEQAALEVRYQSSPLLLGHPRQLPVGMEGNAYFCM